MTESLGEIKKRLQEEIRKLHKQGITSQYQQAKLEGIELAEKELRSQLLDYEEGQVKGIVDRQVKLARQEMIREIEGIPVVAQYLPHYRAISVKDWQSLKKRFLSRETDVLRKENKKWGVA